MKQFILQYGHIQLCIKELVLDKFGQSVWDAIL